MPPRIVDPAACAVDGCDQMATCRGWCRLHYGRWKRQGDPLVVRRTTLRGKDHHRWKGGRFITYAGYVLITLPPGHWCLPMVDRQMYAREHRVVMAEHLGRLLKHSEQVHHINGDRQDNRIENLELRYESHGQGIALACLDCGSHRIVPVPLAT